MAKAKDSGIDTKVAAPAGKPTIGKGVSQPIAGKLGGGTQAMAGSKGKGHAVNTVESQGVTGKNGRGTSAMGSGGIIPGKV